MHKGVHLPRGGQRPAGALPEGLGPGGGRLSAACRPAVAACLSHRPGLPGTAVGRAGGGGGHGCTQSRSATWAVGVSARRRGCGGGVANAQADEGGVTRPNGKREKKKEASQRRRRSSVQSAHQPPPPRQPPGPSPRTKVVNNCSHSASSPRLKLGAPPLLSCLHHGACVGSGGIGAMAAPIPPPCHRRRWSI